MNTPPFSIVVLLIVVSLWGVVGVSQSSSYTDDAVAFKEFMSKYGRSYANEDEYVFRFKTFKQNKAFIEQHNANPARTHDVAINSFGDRTHEEYISTLVEKPFAACYGTSNNGGTKKVPPTNLDWRSTGNVAPVENEGQCGSVSYVNVANQIASVLSISINKPPVPLSAQQMMDCYSSGNDQGCNGGDPWDLYLYVEKDGLEPQSVYPYKGENSTGKCQYEKSQAVASIKGFQNVTNEDDMKTAVATYGPTIALFDASSQEFEYYSSGIFSSNTCSKTELDHVLLLVGYGVCNKTDYWIAQNVWGTDWGMEGYVNILRGKDTCGIATCSSYVTGAYVIQQ